ncbi:hypothetical protein BKA82DRAFT_4010266 [Pisolithus tinctorius]|nr:hypothetical protein BKA82DRAFT_4010266 [Pisolithus tinctorius]
MAQMLGREVLNPEKDGMSQVSKGLGVGGLWGNGSIGNCVSHPFVLSAKLTKHLINGALMEEKEKGRSLLLGLAVRRQDAHHTCHGCNQGGWRTADYTGAVEMWGE